MLENPMFWAAVFFSLTGLGGLIVASFPLRGKGRPPTWLALGHGSGAITSFALLAYACFAAASGVPNLAQIALGVLLLAAVGGATLFFGFHLRGRPLLVPLVLAHGLLALIGVGILWAAVLQ